MSTQMKTLENLAPDLYTLASAVSGPEPWGISGFYAANFSIQSDDRGDYEALIARLDGFFFGLDTTEKTVEPSNPGREATNYLIGDGLSWGLSIRIVGPMSESTRQDRIDILEAELAGLKAGAA